MSEPGTGGVDGVGGRGAGGAGRGRVESGGSGGGVGAGTGSVFGQGVGDFGGGAGTDSVSGRGADDFGGRSDTNPVSDQGVGDFGGGAGTDAVSGQGADNPDGHSDQASRPEQHGGADRRGGTDASTPMKVFVDARWTRMDTHDGISRYGASLVEALHRLHPVTMLIHDERQLRLLPSGVPHVQVNSPLSPRELVLSRTLNRLGADVVFSPLQVIGGFRRRYKLILTLHDLIYYRHPQPPGFLPAVVRIVWRLYHRAYWPQRVLLNRADAVVTVSETTKQLIADYRLTRRPVTVVHNAPSAVPESAEREEGEAGGVRELVYMGSFMPYKNVETLIAGMGALPGHRLHLLSRIEPEREAELAALVPAGADVVFWRGIEDGEYHALLRRATALVTASKDEGFGLPIIEAMNAGAPVVCSDLAIFHEVTGGHALFFEPDSSADFVAAVRKLEDEQARAELVESARRQAEKFTWTSSAKRLLGLMRSLVGVAS